MDVTSSSLYIIRIFYDVRCIFVARKVFNFFGGVFKCSYCVYCWLSTCTSLPLISSNVKVFQNRSTFLPLWNSFPHFKWSQWWVTKNETNIKSVTWQSNYSYFFGASTMVAAEKPDHHARCISPWRSHSKAPADPSPLMCYFTLGACDCLKASAPLFRSFPTWLGGVGGGAGGGVSLLAPCSASVFEVIKSLAAAAAAVERNW